MAVNYGQNKKAWHNKAVPDCGRSEVKFLDNYVKVILYTYSRFEELEKEYESHIFFKALTSYDYRLSTQKTAEYLAGQIIEKVGLKSLREMVDKALKELSEEEMLLLSMRYFGKIDRLKRTLKNIDEKYTDKKEKREVIERTFGINRVFSERSYFRKQKILLEKITRKLKALGLDEDTFEKKYAAFSFFTAVKRYIELGKEVSITQKELDFITLLKDVLWG